MGKGSKGKCNRITLEILKPVVETMKLFLILAVETEVDTTPHPCNRTLFLCQSLLFAGHEAIDCFPPQFPIPIKACSLYEGAISMENNYHFFKLYCVTTDSITPLANM